eukprot:Skav227121  [mRNA]  locus=scaffold199:527750:531500:- [translate_table: standard]
MAAQFIRVLEATDRFLHQIRRLPSASNVQDQRLKVLVNIIDGQSFTSESADSVCAAINKCENFREESKTMLLEKVSAALLETSEDQSPEDKNDLPESKRVALQDYTSLALFIPEKLWEIILDPERPTADSLLWLCFHAHKLGLLHPSEKSYGSITTLAFWSQWQHGQVPLHARIQTLKLTKPFIKQYLEHYNRQNPLGQNDQLKRLPQRVGLLPRRLQAVFAKQPPVRPGEKCLQASQAMPVRITHSAAGVAATGLAAALQMDFKKALGQPSQDLPIQVLQPKEGDELMALGDDSTQEAPSSSLKEPDEPLAICNAEKGAEPDKISELTAVVRSQAAPLRSTAKKTVNYVGATLDDLKSKLKERKAASKGLSSSTAGAAATLKSPEKEKKKNGPPKKTAKSTDPQPKSKQKGIPAASKPKGKALESKEVAAEQNLTRKRVWSSADEQGLVSDCEWPAWASTKVALLKAFPQDTRKRFASRCYHMVLEYELKAGLSKEDSKERARLRHREAVDQFGYVYRVPVLEIGYEHVEEEVRSRILEATKKMAKGKRKSEAIEGEDEEEDLFGSEENQERLKDWESIDSSDEGKAKKGSTGSRAASSKAAGKAKAKAKARAKCSQEEKDAARKANGSIVAAARRGVRLLETANKEAKKATKFIHCPDDLKEEASALAAILKECKQVVNNHAKSTAEGKILDELSMDCDAMKELAKSVKSKADSTCAMAKTLHSMDDAALEKLAEAAKRSREAKNVD